MPQSFADQLRSVPMSPNLAQSLERAHRSARDQSHRLVTLEHLLLALTEDAEAALILQSADVDLGRLSTDISDHLGRLVDDMRAEPGAEPSPDAELLRVLQGAAAAAEKSPRQRIDGAVVLAALVGDGTSPAAGMLNALGMTFEDAIRALRRSNTKVRRQPLVGATTAASAAVVPTGAARDDAEPLTPEAQRPVSDAPAAEARSSGAKPLVAQSAEEILAAARARIQQRAAAKVAKPEASVTHESAPQSESEAIGAAMGSRGSKPALLTMPSPPSPAADDVPEKAEPASGAFAPTTPAAARQTQSAWTPLPSEPRREPAARAPQSPFPAKPMQPNEGTRRSHPLLADGSLTETTAVAHHRAERPDMAARPSPLPPRPAPTPRDGQRERALLMERVPRRMRAGVPATAEVRVARDKVDVLVAALHGRGSPQQGDASLARALSVRLGATEGRFWIEPMLPETRWVDSSPGTAQDEPIIWRWTVVPRCRGRSRLTLMVSAHGMSRNGVAARSAPTRRKIEVNVRANNLRRAARLAGWGVALAAGAVIGRHGQEYWAPALAAFRKALAMAGV